MIIDFDSDPDSSQTRAASSSMLTGEPGNARRRSACKAGKMRVGKDFQNDQYLHIYFHSFTFIMSRTIVPVLSRQDIDAAQIGAERARGSKPGCVSRSCSCSINSGATQAQFLGCIVGRILRNVKHNPLVSGIRQRERNLQFS